MSNRRPASADFLTRVDSFGYAVRKEIETSQHSGNRARQSCGFFTSGHSMAGRARIQDPATGKKRTDCARVSTSPAAMQRRLKPALCGNSRLAQEHVMQTQASPRGRGRPRKALKALCAVPQFPGTLIQFDSRPRLMVGDVVELCRGCLPGNAGIRCIVTGFDEKGFVLIRSMWKSMDSIDLDTGEVRQDAGPHGRTPPENLYRLSRDLAKGYWGRP